MDLDPNKEWKSADKLEKGHIIKHKEQYLIVTDALYRGKYNKFVTGLSTIPLRKDDPNSESDKITIQNDGFDFRKQKYLPEDWNSVVISALSQPDEYPTGNIQKNDQFHVVGKIKPKKFAEIEQKLDKELNHSKRTPTPRKKTKKIKSVTTSPDLLLEDAMALGYITEEDKKDLSEQGLVSLFQAAQQAPILEIDRLKPNKIKNHPVYQAAQQIEVESDEILKHMNPAMVNILRAQKSYSFGHNLDDRDFPLSEAFDTFLTDSKPFVHYVRPSDEDKDLTKTQAHAMKNGIRHAFKSIGDKIQGSAIKNAKLGHRHFLTDMINQDSANYKKLQTDTIQTPI